MQINKLQQGNIIRTIRGNFIKDKNGVLHVLNNKGDIEQLLDGEIVVKPKPKLSAFTKATIGSAIASDPAVMLASGWKLDNRGNWKQERTKGSDILSENISTISSIPARFAPTQLARDVYNLAYEVPFNNMSWKEFGNQILLGNNGIISDKNAMKNPLSSAIINGIVDFGVTSKGITNLNKAQKINTVKNIVKRGTRENLSNITIKMGSMPKYIYDLYKQERSLGRNKLNSFFKAYNKGFETSGISYDRNKSVFVNTSQKLLPSSSYGDLGHELRHQIQTKIINNRIDLANNMEELDRASPIVYDQSKRYSTANSLEPNFRAMVEKNKNPKQDAWFTSPNEVDAEMINANIVYPSTLKTFIGLNKGTKDFLLNRFKYSSDDTDKIILGLDKFYPRAAMPTIEEYNLLHKYDEIPFLLGSYVPSLNKVSNKKYSTGLIPIGINTLK